MMCRLCLCLVDKQIGYSSLVDPAFNEMVKYVFNFAIPREKCIDGKPNSLPVLICLQCSRRVREFYSFGKMVESNQKNFISESANRNNTSSVDELLQYIKPNPAPEAGTGNHNVEDSLWMFAEVVDRESELFSALEEEDKRMSKKNPSICDDKQEVSVRISKMEISVGIIMTKLISALDKFPKQHNTQARRVSFEFSPITEEAQLIVLDEQLKQKEYFETFLDWINSHISLEDTGFQRMHEAIDLIFSRPFFAACNWTGTTRQDATSSIKKKVALGGHKQVVFLFRTIGSTKENKISDHVLAQFFQNKFKRAASRVNIQGIRRRVCRSRVLDPD